MNEPKGLVSFAFAYFNKRPAGLEDFNADSWLRYQNTMVARFAHSHGHEIIRRLPGFSIGRRKAFTQTRHFHDAVAFAQAHGAELILGDLQELLNRTPATMIADCIAVLDDIEVDLWDARRERTWRSLDAGRRRSIEELAMISSQAKSTTIRAGLSLAQRDHAASSKNAARASAANAHKADQRAEDLRAFVERELAKMPAGKTLSPSMLTRRFNEAGIAAPRGGAWSHNSAKNLLHRLRLPTPDEPPVIDPP